MIDDPVHHGVVGEKGNNAHLSLARGTGQGIYFIDFFDHLGPASAGDPRAILLDEDEFLRTSLQLGHLPPVGIGVEAVISDSDLSLVWDMGSDFLSERLDDGHHPGDKFCASCGLKIFEKGLDCRPAELAEELALVFEEDAQHLGDGEDNLAVGDIQQKLLPHPLAPLLQALGMTRGTKPAGTAGEHQEPLLPTVGTADAGKAAARIAAVQVALNHLLDDRPEEAVVLLKTTLVLHHEPVKVMEQHPVEDGAFWMTGAIDP